MKTEWRTKIAARIAAEHWGQKIVALPRPSAPAADVSIDGVYYASFKHLSAAQEAVELWRENWPAVDGRRLTVRAFA